MIRKVVAIGALGLIIAVSACEPNKRNPDDRVLKAGVENPMP